MSSRWFFHLKLKATDLVPITAPLANPHRVILGSVSVVPSETGRDQDSFAQKPALMIAAAASTYGG